MSLECNHISEGIQRMVAGGICISVTECWHNKPTFGRARLLTASFFPALLPYQKTTDNNVCNVIQPTPGLHSRFSVVCAAVHVLTWWYTHWWVLPCSIITAVNSTVSHQSGATIAKIICSCSPGSTYRVTRTNYTCSAICNLWRRPTIN